MQKQHRITIALDPKNKILDGEDTRRNRELTYIYGVSGFVYESLIQGEWIVMDTCNGFAADWPVSDLLSYVEPESGAEVLDESEVEVIDLRPDAIWTWEYQGDDGDDMLDVWGRVV